MTNSTWTGGNSGDYNSALNWSLGIPGANDTAFFGTSVITDISVGGLGTVFNINSWVFNSWALHYSVTMQNTADLFFNGAGIVINGGSVNFIVGPGNTLQFFNDSSAGAAGITNRGHLFFADGSNAGGANISNKAFLVFGSDSSAANSIITNFAGGSPTLGVFFQDHSTTGTAEVETLGGGATMFSDFSTGGTAQFNTDTGGTVDFSGSEGPAGDNKLTAGSIAGAGTYHLGANQLTVLSGNVSGLIDGLGGALVKAGKGTLTLSGAGNTYSGGTILEQGTLELDAIGAAGPGAITFASIGKTKATLEIDNAALSAHHFGNSTDNFGKHDFVDLTGLRFHAGATATYHKANHNLTVHSGSATDTLTLLSPHGTHFAAASDHHGGTDVFLFFA